MECRSLTLFVGVLLSVIPTEGALVLLRQDSASDVHVLPLWQKLRQALRLRLDGMEISDRAVELDVDTWERGIREHNRDWSDSVLAEKRQPELWDEVSYVARFEKDHFDLSRFSPEEGVKTVATTKALTPTLLEPLSPPEIARLIDVRAASPPLAPPPTKPLRSTEWYNHWSVWAVGAGVAAAVAVGVFFIRQGSPTSTLSLE